MNTYRIVPTGRFNGEKAFTAFDIQKRVFGLFWTIILRDYATRAAAEERIRGLLADEARVIEHLKGRKVYFGELPA